MACEQCGKSKPTILKQATSFVRSSYNVVKQAASGGDVITNKDIYQYRIDKCLKCYYSCFERECSVCGCNFREKAKAITEKCPKGMW